MTEAYAYIKRAYGQDFSIGNKVRIHVYGVEGEVIAPLHHRQNYVRCRWRDELLGAREGDFHPADVTVIS